MVFGFRNAPSNRTCQQCYAIRDEEAVEKECPRLPNFLIELEDLRRDQSRPGSL